jgi:type I restriction enzyme S subunit
MNRDLKPYPEYKDSGVPWLGKVPAHWGMKRGKWLFRSMKEINADRQHTNILSLTLRGVVNNDPDDPEGLVPKDYGTYQLFAKGDLVFKLIDLENLRTSRVGLVHEDGIMSPAYVRLVPRHNGVQRFFFRQYFDLYQRGIFNQLGAGVRATLGPKDLLELPVVVPNVSEQSAIVRFLDHVDRKIKKHIRAKQKLIKLLTEQKQAIIQRAVTRGLDPTVRLKPSGVPWLGKVPAHWEVLPNRALFAEVRDRDHADAEMLSVTITKGVIRQKALLGDSSKKDSSNEDKSSYKLVCPGDIAYNKMRAWQGAVGVSEFRGIISPAYVVQRPRRGAEPRYFHYLLRTPAFAKEAERWSYGITSDMWSLRPEHFKMIYGCLPSIPEQSAIVRYLDGATANLDKAIDAAHREIDLLREYRTRLIADVVTGKLDVREAAANLPEEAEEAEVLDESEAQTEGGEDGDAGEADAAAEETES